MIRIRPGRSWRLNPGYLYELRGLDEPRARSFNGGGILDVLGIEVDGVDIAAQVGEAQVLLAVDELAQALLELGDGKSAAQATVGPGPVELLLEARGQDVLLTLVSLAPPPKILAKGLQIDLAKLRAAVAAAARGLLFDLLAISPTLADSALSLRLSQAAGRLSRQPRRSSQSFPAHPPQAEPLFLRGKQEASARCDLELDSEGAARLASRARVPGAPLAALLGTGTLTLHLKGAEAIVCAAPLYLLLRDLARQAAALVQAWEAGERSFNLSLGAEQLHCDLTLDQVHARGWKRGYSCGPVQLALALGGAIAAFADRALTLQAPATKAKPSARKRKAREPSVPADELLADLGAAARALSRHCRDLATGDLRRAPAAVSAPAARLSRVTRPPPTRGKVRRLIYRETWHEALATPLRPLQLLDCGVLVLEGPQTVSGREAKSGRELWERPCAKGSIARELSGGDLYLSEPGDDLVRLDPLTGEVHFRRRMRATALPDQRVQLWPVPGGVLRALPGEGLAQVSSAGTLGFRVKLPGGAPEHALACEGVLLLGLSTGSLCALDPSDGRVLWKRKLGARILALQAPSPGSSAGALALSAASDGRLTLALLDCASGVARWESSFQGSAESALVALGDRVVVQEGPLLHALSLHDGAARNSFTLPWTRDTTLSAADDDELSLHLLATGPGGASLRLDERLVPRWRIAAEGEEPLVPALGPGLLLLPRGGFTTVFDTREGLPVAQLPASTLQLIGRDLSVALLDLHGRLCLQQLATHLSVL